MIIWYIDEHKDDLFTYKKQLENILQGKVKINAIEPSKNIDEMINKILTEKRTVAVIIDQRLGDAVNSVSYNGLDLARAIRQLNNKLPLYILTNYTDDLSSNEWEIEYVFAKDDFKTEKRMISERVKRHISIFFNLVDEREKRFAELLKKSISETLTKDEIKEFENLEYFRSAIVLEDEAAKTPKLKEQLDKQEELLKQIKAKLGEIDDKHP